MKGMSEGLMILVGIILSIIMLAIFFEITSYTSEKSNERSAVMSLNSLARHIDSVCESNTPGYYEDVDISMPQSGVIYPRVLKPLLKLTLATMQISNRGDPDFLIYYESFPQIEDLDWLIPVRNNILPFYINYTKDGSVNVPNYDEIYPTFFYNETKGYMLVSNIIPFNSTEGKWDKKHPWIYIYNTSSYDVNVKLMRKYQICGNHSLCLKTSDFLYRKELKCTEPIELERGGAEASGVIKKIWENAAFSLGNTSTSFYLASPCKIKLRIRKGTCKFYKNMTIPIYNRSGIIGYHTIYQKASENVLINGTMYKEHIEQINDIDDMNNREVQCIQIEPLNYPYGFCYASPDLIAGLFYGTFNMINNKGEMWFIGYEDLDIMGERNKIENYILSFGIGKIKQFFFTWPDHPIN